MTGYCTACWATCIEECRNVLGCPWGKYEALKSDAANGRPEMATVMRSAKAPPQMLSSGFESLTASGLSVNINEFDEAEWYSFARAFKPGLTREEFAKMWAEFQEAKTRKALQ